MEGKIEFLIDYTHNVYSCDDHEGKEFIDPIEDISVLKATGIYDKKKIKDYLDTWSKIEILKILSLKTEGLNLLQLKKILGYSYSSLHNHISKMKKLKLIIIEKNKSEKGKVEKRIKLNKKVEVIPLSQDKKEEILGYIKKQIENSDVGKKYFVERLKKDLKKISKEPTDLKAKKGRKERRH